MRRSGALAFTPCAPPTPWTSARCGACIARCARSCDRGSRTAAPASATTWGLTASRAPTPNAWPSTDAPSSPATDAAAASVAGLLGASVDGQAFGVGARLAVSPHVVAEAGAAVRDPLSQDLAHRAMQAPHLALVHGVGGAQGVKASAPERLIGVDVAYPGNEALVEEQRLQLRRPPCQPLGKAFRREGALERLW